MELPRLSRTLELIVPDSNTSTGSNLTSRLIPSDHIPVATRDYDPDYDDVFSIDPLTLHLPHPKIPLGRQRKVLKINVLDGFKGKELDNLNQDSLITNALSNQRMVVDSIVNAVRNVRTRSKNGRPIVFDQETYSMMPSKPTFIIGDYLFEEFNENEVVQNQKKYIGLRLLHALEIEVPQNIGILRTGNPDVPHLDSSNLKQLDYFNNFLAEQNSITRQSISERWKGRVALVDVVIDPAGRFDFSELDINLSETVYGNWL